MEREKVRKREEDAEERVRWKKMKLSEGKMGAQKKGRQVGEKT